MIPMGRYCRFARGRRTPVFARSGRLESTLNRPSKTGRSEVTAYGFQGTTPAAIVHQSKEQLQGRNLNDVADCSGDQAPPFSSVPGGKSAVRIGRNIGLRHGSAVQAARSDDLGAGW